MFLVDITDLPRYFAELFLVRDMASNHPVRVIRFFVTVQQHHIFVRFGLLT